MQIQTGEMCLQPTYELLRNLEVRASAMICFYTNAKELHDTKVPFAFNSLPRRRARTLESTATFQMPELYVSTQALLAVAGKSPSERISWTKQSLEISFTGLEKALQSAHIPSGKLVNDKRRLTTDITSPPSTQSSLPQLSQPSALKLPLTPVQSLSQQGSATPAASEAIFTARGHLNSLMPSSLLSKPVDNVSFHPDSGGFAFRLASRVGDGVIKPATDQLRRVERLVDFVNVVQRYPDAVAADSVGLQKVVFSYWCAPLSQTQMLDLTKEQATIEFPAASSTEQKPTTVLPPKLDLTDGNPHIRVKDFLSDILSSPAGLEGLVRCLLLTLPIVRGLDQAEDSWSKLCASTRNEFYILPRTAEWYSLRYAFDLGERGTVRLHLDLTCRNRNGESWWWIKKYNPKRERVNLTPAQLAVDNVLRQKFWEAPGAELWETEIGGAYAKPGAAEMMLLAVDEVLRQIALDPSSLVIDETPVPGDRADSGASGAAKQEQATSAQLQAKAAAMQLNLPPPVKARQAQAKPVPRRPSATTAQSSPKQGMSQPLSGQQGAPVAQMHVGQHQPQQQAGMVRQPSSQGQQPGQQRKSISPAMQKKHQAAMVQAQQQQQQQRMAAQMAQMQGRPMNQQQQAMMQLQLQQQQQQLQARQRSSQGGANKDEPVILD